MTLSVDRQDRRTTPPLLHPPDNDTGPTYKHYLLGPSTVSSLVVTSRNPTLTVQESDPCQRQDMITGTREFWGATGAGAGKFAESGPAQERGLGLITDENQHTARSMQDQLRTFLEVRNEHLEDPTHTFTTLDTHVNFETEGIDNRLHGALLVPLLGHLQSEAHARGIRPVAMLGQTAERTDIPNIQAFLQRTGTVGSDGRPQRKGKMLVGRPAIAGYTHLTASYLPYFAYTEGLYKGTMERGWGGDVDRLQPDNAYASNELIQGITRTIAARMRDMSSIRDTDNPGTVLDFGSGGGLQLLALAQEGFNIAGMDIDPKAHREAQTLLERHGYQGTFHVGDLTSSKQLRHVAEEVHPDQTLINYILHDLAGLGETKQEGHEIVRQFLAHHRDSFGDIPLWISEALHCDPKTLRRDGKVVPVVFQHLHAISPQRLFTLEELCGLLEDTGYRIDEKATLVHRHTQHNGDAQPQNMTIRAIPR